MIGMVKTLIKAVPVLGPVLTRWRAARGPAFTTSSDYWDRRYRSGGTSGAGSYDRLAEFKANFLNAFVTEQHIETVIEYGSGDGAQLRAARYPSYTGIDVSAKAVEMCQAIFVRDASKRFLRSDEVPPSLSAELTLSLDVIYHIIEDAVFEAYMRQLFGSASRFVIIYSSNMNTGWPDRHVRHRRFTDWVEQHRQEWFLYSVTPNRFPYDPADPDNTSFADFYVFAHR
jgi:hypothetical protein